MTPQLVADIQRIDDAIERTMRSLGRADVLDKINALRAMPLGPEGIPEKLQAVLEGLPVVAAAAIIKTLTIRFHLINRAEQIEIARINRDRERNATAENPRAESIAEAVGHLRQEGRTIEQVLQIIQRLDVQPTLTAHPTEARRRSVLSKQKRIAECLEQLHDPNLTEREQSAFEDEIHRSLQLLFTTDEVRSERLQVHEEVRNGLHYLTTTIWDTVPQLHRDLEDAIRTEYGQWPSLPAFLRYRSWIGGDRDGNPFVTPKVTRDTLATFRNEAVSLHAQALLELRRDLSVSQRLVAVSEELLEAIERDGTDSLRSEAVRHLRYEPFRVRVLQILAKLEAVRSGESKYTSKQFINDLEVLQRSLRLCGLSDVANRGRLADIVVRARTFGFHLATLDIRQHSDRHRSAIAELLRFSQIEPEYGSLDEPARLKLLARLLADPRPLLPRHASLSETTLDTIGAFEVVRDAMSRDPDSIGCIIISMTHEVSHLLEALVLCREVGLSRLVDGRVESDVDLVPLFETIDDLTRCGPLMDDLFRNNAYHAHLKARNMFQEIMLGYSDSNKDGGYWIANWALHKAEASLARTCREHSVDFRMFHGRGGTVGRGGGRANRAILATPRESRNGRIRFTEQGEVISFRYAMPAIARRHMEQIVSAMLRGTVIDEISESEDPHERSDSAAEMMERVAAHSMTAYRSLVRDDDFWAWYVATSPIEHISRLPIASRPVSRAKGAVVLDTLRAIPWVFAWTQMRYTVPGWYGVGTGLGQLDSKEARAQLADLYQTWPFFQMLINNAQQELARARLIIAKAYGHQSDRSIHDRIVKEFEQAEGVILELTGQTALLENNPVIRNSIAFRNLDTDILNLMQIELLNRARAGTDDTQAVNEAMLLSINGLAAAMQSTG